MMGQGSVAIASSGSERQEASGRSEPAAPIDDGYVDLACSACGRVHPSAKVVTLPDGRMVSSYSEEWRLWTEAKAAMALPDKVDRRRKGPHVSKREYIQLVREARGDDAADALRAVMAGLWEANRKR